VERFFADRGGKQRETVQVLTPFRYFLEDRGWKCYKTHGNQYQEGFPDLYIVHPEYDPRWVETKLLDGELTPAQVRVFSEWVVRKVRLHIVAANDLRGKGGYDIVQCNRIYQCLFKGSNVHIWLNPMLREHRGVYM
jgi:hypothetical protein